jgi:hypothetical protein
MGRPGAALYSGVAIAPLSATTRFSGLGVTAKLRDVLESIAGHPGNRVAGLPRRKLRPSTADCLS